MGDRRNVILDYGNDNKIYFYSHWGGTDLPATVAYALQRGKERWDDPPYLARIIFSELIRDEYQELTGYGISPDIVDTEYSNEEVCLDLVNLKAGIGKATTPFSEFIRKHLS